MNERWLYAWGRPRADEPGPAEPWQWLTAASRRIERKVVPGTIVPLIFASQASIAIDA
jgi:hypothetical protein